MDFDYKQLAKEIVNYQQSESLRMQQELVTNLKSIEVSKPKIFGFVKPSLSFFIFYSIAVCVFCALLLELFIFIICGKTLDFLTLFYSVYVARMVVKYAFFYDAYRFIHDFKSALYFKSKKDLV